jgi:hypothetical protein
VKPKIKWAGAPIPKRRVKQKVKSKGGRPRRRRPSEDEIKIMVRPWIPNALRGDPYVLPMLRGRVDNVYIAEEAYRFLATQARNDGRPVERDNLIERIADWLKMDAAELKNWLNRSKRAR